MNLYSDFANRLKEERKRLYLTQVEIAKRCGVSARMWVKYEQGASMPGGEVIWELARQGFNLPYLFLDAIDRPRDDKKVAIAVF